jgi:hypothetical protein
MSMRVRWRGPPYSGEWEALRDLAGDAPSRAMVVIVPYTRMQPHPVARVDDEDAPAASIATPVWPV